MPDLTPTNTSKYLRWGVIALAVVLFCFLVYLNRTTFVILAVSYVIAYILNPVIEKFETHKISRYWSIRISRFWAIWIATGLAVLISILIFLIIVPQVTTQAQSFQGKISGWKQGIISWITSDENQPSTEEELSNSNGQNGENESQGTNDPEIGSASASFSIGSTSSSALIEPSTSDTEIDSASSSDSMPSSSSPVSVLQSLQLWAQKNPFMQENVIPLLEEVNQNVTNKPLEETKPSDYAKTIWGQIKAYRDTLWNSFVGAIQKTYQGVTGLIVGILNFIMLPVFTFYFLVDYKRINSGFYDMMPPQWRVVVKDWLGEIDQVLGNFIRGQFMIACILALIFSIGLSILQVPMGAVIGIVAGMANMVPYMSIVVGLVPALLFALIDNGDVMQLVWVLLIFVGGQSFEGLYLSPRIMSGEVGLHPVVVIVAIIVGGTLFGLAGVLLAVPVTAVLKVIFQRLHKQWQSTWEPLP